MAQDDYTVANAAGATVRADLNSQLAAIVSQNSGAAAPTTTFAEQVWYDTTNDILKQRNSANSAWIDLIHFDQTNGLFRIDLDKGADIASAATTDIGAATGNYAVVTGTTTITALGTIKAGTHRWVRFSGALLLTHNGTSLILPGGASITTAAGDVMLAISEGSGNWRVAFYQKADGTPVAGGGTGAFIGFQVITATGTYTPTAGTASVVAELRGAGGGGGGADSLASNTYTAGGGGGQGEKRIVRVTSLGATETVTINAGGTAGTNTGTAGGTGGTTVFGAHATANGGSGGGGTGAAAAGGVVADGGLGGTGGSGGFGVNGQDGGGGSADSSLVAPTTRTIGGLGGGEGGGRTGVAGTSGGGGGGGASINVSGDAGGAGGDGYIIIWEYS